MRAVDLFFEQWQVAKESGLPFDAYFHDGKTMRVRIGKVSARRKSALPLCGAKCRDGHPCKARVCLKSDGSAANRCQTANLLASFGDEREREADELRASIESFRRYMSVGGLKYL